MIVLTAIGRDVDSCRKVAYPIGAMGRYFRTRTSMNPGKLSRKRLEAMGFTSAKAGPTQMPARVVVTSKKSKAMKRKSRVDILLVVVAMSKDRRDVVSRPFNL